MTVEKKTQQSDSNLLPTDGASSVIRFRVEPDPVAGGGVGSAAAASDVPRTTDPYQQLLDCIYDAVVVSTVTGEIIDANQRSEDSLLFDKHELCRMRVMDLVVGAGEDLLPVVMENLNKQKYVLLEAKCVRKDGSRFSAEIAVSRLLCCDQIKLSFFIRDLTVRKQAEKALKEALYKLEKQDRARALLVSNVSHELRTPLTSMTYGISNLLSGVAGSPDPQVMQYLERFDRECRRLLCTVEDILDLERIETRTMRLVRIRVPVSRLIARSMGTMDPQARYKDIKLTVVKPADKPVFVYCDPSKIERVLLNVFSNAVKYTPRGGAIEVRTEQTSGRYGFISIRIEDSGIGIPAHALDRVMDRYYRVGEHADGAGLGLAIAKEITEMHGGSIQIASPPPGKKTGTMVSIDLPSIDAPDVLFLGSDPVSAQAAGEEFGQLGCRFASVTSSKAAFDLLHARRVAVLMVEMPLTGEDGMELVAALLGEERSRRIAVMVLAGGELSSAKQEILGSFSIPVLSKPWKADQLIDGVEQAFLGALTREKGKVV